MKQIICLIAISFCLNSQAQMIDFYTNQLLVMVKDSSDIEKLVNDYNRSYPIAEVSVKKTISKELDIYLLQFNESELHYENALLFALRNNTVEIAQYNHNNLVLRSTPNDPDFPQMWNMLNDGVNGNIADADIDAEEAWGTTTGGTTVLGDTIVVAVVDNGFSLSHPDLDFWVNKDEIPSNGQDDDNDGYIDDINGWNAYNQDGDITSSSHGTHVSGTIGAKGNNNLGVAGVNWNVKVMAIQGSSSDESTVLEAYGYIYKQRLLYNQTNGTEGAFVVSTNSSFGVDQGQPSGYPLWCAFYDSLGSVGILNAGATANQNWDIDVMGDIPTACASGFMIAVTNTTSSDSRNNGAAYGLTTIDIGAPGTGIISTLPGSSYGQNTGTSMATPHVAGAIALMYAAACNDMLTAFSSDPQGLALAMRNHLLNSGWDANNDLNGNTTTGGRLNLHKALVAVKGNSFCAPAGINEQANKNELNIYPNPTNDWLNLSSSSPLKEIKIYDNIGRLIKIAKTANKINVKDLRRGIYIVSAIAAEGKVLRSKIVVE